MAESVTSPENNNAFGLIGTKMGMSRVFGSDGESIPVTVINIGLNVVSSLKSYRQAWLQCSSNRIQRS